MAAVDCGVITDWKFISQIIVKAKSAVNATDPKGLYRVVTYYSPMFNVYKNERIKIEPLVGQRRMSMS